MTRSIFSALGAGHVFVGSLMAAQTNCSRFPYIASSNREALRIEIDIGLANSRSGPSAVSTRFV
jgi:hypothetical protein